MGWIYWFSVAMAMLGTVLILNWHELDFYHLKMGDFLTLICSVLAAVHIIVIGKKAPQSENDFAFNSFQSMWVALPCLLFLFNSSQGWNLMAMNQLGWIGMLSLTLGSSLIAFYLQVRAQRILSPSTASLLFLLESPTSCLFAFWLLNERMSLLQFFGAFLILIACMLISLPKASRRTLPF
jgi:drug/metabolite transporter (DMT)-like permease